MEDLNYTNLFYDHSILKGDIFKGFISHVIDDETFYLIKSDAAIILLDIEVKLKEKDLSKMFWYPQINEKFIFCQKDEYFRALRIPENVENSTFNNIHILMLDTGETILIPLKDNLYSTYTYMAPEEMKNINPLAKKCKWVKFSNTEQAKHETFLQDNLYKKLLKFEALDIKNDLLYITIFPDDNNALEENINENKMPSQDSFFTKDELDELYEEPLDTEDALVAVHGYAARYSEKLCQFYNQNTGACFKGSMCKLQHLPLSTEYDCRDRQEEFFYKENVDKIVQGKTYDIKITCLIAVDRFIFYFEDSKFFDKYNEINAIINDPNECKDYVKLKIHPQIDDLVLLKHQKFFFRAKVIDINSDNIEVWCIDSGILISTTIENLYKWKLRFNDFSYLTNEMEIDNISPIRAKSMQAVYAILKYQDQNKYLRVKITSTVPHLKCRLLNDKNIDIGELLIADLLVNRKEFEFSNYDDQIVPI